MNIDLTLIALGIAALAAPASAETNSTKQNRTGNAVAAQATKYCIQYEKVTGSRLHGQECKTKREWADDGVDVDKLLSK